MKKLIRFVFIATVLFWILNTILNITPSKTDAPLDYESGNCKQYQVNYNRVHSTQRSWIDFKQREFCLRYNTNSDYCTQSTVSYLNFQPQTPWSLDNDEQYFGEIYHHLYTQDKDTIQYITDSLYHLADSRDLSQKELAEMIVTFVQDIPYSYVFSDYPCDKRENKNLPCVEGYKYGLLTPINFLHTLTGDCDTRAVLLYTILKQLGYKVTIVVSYEYLHAMIAIDLPYTGEFIEHQQRKYYFWETTATGWRPGFLPPDCNNINYWKIALI